MRLAFLYIARHSFCRSVYFFASMDRWNSQTNKREFLFRTQLSEIGGQKSQKTSIIFFPPKFNPKRCWVVSIAEWLKRANGACWFQSRLKFINQINITKVMTITFLSCFMNVARHYYTQTGMDKPQVCQPSQR